MGEILDREGRPLVTNVTTTEIRLSRAEATLHPTVKGSLSSLTGLSVKQISADLHDLQYSPYQPAPIMANAPARDVEFIKLHPGEFPGVSVLDVSRRSYPNGGNVAAQVLGYVGPITGTEIKDNPGAGYEPDSTIGKTGIESLLRAILARQTGKDHLGSECGGNTDDQGTQDDRTHRGRQRGAEHRHRSAEGPRTAISTVQRSWRTVTRSTRSRTRCPKR